MSRSWPSGIDVVDQLFLISNDLDVQGVKLKNNLDYSKIWNCVFEKYKLSIRPWQLFRVQYAFSKVHHFQTQFIIGKYNYQSLYCKIFSALLESLKDLNKILLASGTKNLEAWVQVAALIPLAWLKDECESHPLLVQNLGDQTCKGAFLTVVKQYYWKLPT